MRVAKLISTISRWTSENFLWLLLGGYAAAALLPGLGLWLARFPLGTVPVLGEPVRVSPPMLLLACLLASAGLEVPLGHLRHLLRRPLPLLVGLVANTAVPV